jgi:hypothetical protein
MRKEKDMPRENMPTIDSIVRTYKTKINEIASVVGNPKHHLRKDKNGKPRAIGGVVRDLKGKLLECITAKMVKIAWHNLGGSPERLEVNSEKIRIPIQQSYVQKIKETEVREHILKNIEKYHYGLSVDKHIFVDGKLVMAIECKAYTENAMMKKILVDFQLLRLAHPQISCFLFQLESQLGGDYSKLPKTVYGSFSTHSIMSYFENVDLHIFTFLGGERNIKKPIHEFFKPLKTDNVAKAVKLLESYLKEFV